MPKPPAPERLVRVCRLDFGADGDRERAPARARLAELVGDELAARLVTALSRRPRSRPGSSGSGPARRGRNEFTEPVALSSTQLVDPSASA
jgi:hypothetical protein